MHSQFGGRSDRGSLHLHNVASTRFPKQKVEASEVVRLESLIPSQKSRSNNETMLVACASYDYLPSCY
jgi:hypothetical protein